MGCVNLAAARGRLGGRRKSLNPDQRALVVSLYECHLLPKNVTISLLISLMFNDKRYKISS
ncbi:hypothetical protein HW44_14315 [Nitrosococcus oceani]|nr:hypothetical protein HW44_14315 [Nitrosococcus oceani]